MGFEEGEEKEEGGLIVISRIPKASVTGEGVMPSNEQTNRANETKKRFPTSWKRKDGAEKEKMKGVKDRMCV